MFLYFSTFTGDGSPTNAFRPTAADEVQLEGGIWSCFDLRTDCSQLAGRCLVGSSIQLTTIPAGVTFLLDTQNLETTVPTNVLNTINNQLGSSVPNGITWRQVLKRLAQVEGNGKWGQVVGDFIHFASESISL